MPQLLYFKTAFLNLGGYSASRTFFLKQINEGIFLFLDFENAFDSIESSLLFKTLEKYKFKYSCNLIKRMKTK